MGVMLASIQDTLRPASTAPFAWYALSPVRHPGARLWHGYCCRTSAQSMHCSNVAMSLSTVIVCRRSLAAVTLTADLQQKQDSKQPSRPATRNCKPSATPPSQPTAMLSTNQQQQATQMLLHRLQQQAHQYQAYQVLLVRSG